MASRVLRRLRDLLDVDASGLADGDVPTWDSGTSKFTMEPGGSGGSLPDPIVVPVNIEPASGDVNNSGLRIESPAEPTDYNYVLVLTVEDPGNPGQYLPIFNVDSAGEITGIVQDFAGGAIPLSLVKPDASLIFRVDQNATVNVGAGGVKFPTSDPLIAGAWWDDAGTLTKSAG